MNNWLTEAEHQLKTKTQPEQYKDETPTGLRTIYPSGTVVEWAKAVALIDIAKSLRVLSNRLE